MSAQKIEKYPWLLNFFVWKHKIFQLKKLPSKIQKCAWLLTFSQKKADTPSSKIESIFRDVFVGTQTLNFSRLSSLSILLFISFT